MTWAYGMRMDAPNEGTDYRSIRDTDGCSECADDVNLAEELVDADRPVLVVVHAVRPLPRIPLHAWARPPPPHLTPPTTLLWALRCAAADLRQSPRPERLERVDVVLDLHPTAAANAPRRIRRPHATPTMQHANVGNEHSRTRRAHIQNKTARRCGPLRAVAVRCGAVRARKPS